MTPLAWILVWVFAFTALDTLVFVLWLPYEYQEDRVWCLLPGGGTAGCIVYAWRRYKVLRNRKRAFNSVGVSNVELRKAGWPWWLLR